MKTRNKGCLTVIIAISVLFIASDLTRRFGPSRARRALPSSAQEINEKWMGLGFFGDFSRVLKARLPEEDYSAFVKNLGLETQFDPVLHDGTNRIPVNIHVGGPKWWNEPQDLENCFFVYEPEHDYVCRVQYRNGFVYFTEAKW